MRKITILAIVLLVIGIIAFTYQGITYTTQEKVLDFGPLQVTAETTRTFPLPPIIGAVAILGGVVLLVVGRKKS